MVFGSVLQSYYFKHRVRAALLNLGYFIQPLPPSCARGKRDCCCYCCCYCCCCCCRLIQSNYVGGGGSSCQLDGSGVRRTLLITLIILEKEVTKHCAWHVRVWVLHINPFFLPVDIQHTTLCVIPLHENKQPQHPRLVDKRVATLQ